MSNVPIFLTQEQLVELLTDILNRVKAHDSFEGSIEYTMPWNKEFGDPETDGGNGYRVRAAYRVGNSQGQGGMRMVGKVE